MIPSCENNEIEKDKSIPKSISLLVLVSNHEERNTLIFIRFIWYKNVSPAVYTLTTL